MGYLFLDSCVILSEILGQTIGRITKLKKDIIGQHLVKCFFSDSIKVECDKKMKKTTDFIGRTLKESIETTLLERRKTNPSTPLDYQDILALEDIFTVWRMSAKGGPLISPIEAIEEWAITFLGEKVTQPTPVDTHTFLLELTKRTLLLMAKVQSPYDELITFEKGWLQKTDEIPDPEAIKAMSQIGIHMDDVNHIAVAVNRIKHGERAVFVTMDHRILSRREEIFARVKIKCSDPIYAIYHLM